MRVYTGEKLYKCQYCEKDFGQSRSSKIHLKVHRDQFNYSTSFTSHMSIHTKERSRKCQYCQMELTDCLTRHMRVHTREKECIQWEKDFQHSNSYKDHLESHDKEKRYPLRFGIKVYYLKYQLKVCEVRLVRLGHFDLIEHG